MATPQLHWYRTESHASPLGHEFRAEYRGRTWRMYRLADGSWKVVPTDRPQQTKTFWKPEEARKWAAQAAMTNPGRKRNPQETNMAKKPKKNPMRGARKVVSSEVDEHAAQDLRLFIDHDGELYRQRRIPIERNLTKKWKKGTFDAARATDAYMYLVEAGAKKYAKEFASPSDWNKIFTKATRDYVADEYATDFAHDISEIPDAYDHLLEKNPGKRRRNPARKKNGAGLGALIGSTIGAVAGFGAGSIPLAALGSLAGGTVGGYFGAPKDRKKRGAAGGAIGGALLGPVGAGVGGWIGGKRADADYGGRRHNPSKPTRQRNPPLRQPKGGDPRRTFYIVEHSDGRWTVHEDSPTSTALLVKTSYEAAEQALIDAEGGHITVEIIGRNPGSCGCSHREAAISRRVSRI